MKITIGKDQEQRIAGRVAAGEYPSAEALVEAAVEKLLSSIDAPDFDAKELDALCAAGLDQISRGEAHSIDEVRKHFAAKIASRKAPSA